MSEEMITIGRNIRNKYMLDNPNFTNGSSVYFIFIDETRCLEKEIKKGKIINLDNNRYTVQSDEKYNIPKFLAFINRYRAEEILHKISVDELRFLI